MTSSNIVVKMTGITKTFPGVKALDNVDFTLREGEVHAIVGENGAGKTTLIKTLTGVLSADSGEIVLDNRSVHFHNPLDAQLAGISTVYQEVNLCENLSVAENIYRARADETGTDRLENHLPGVRDHIASPEPQY